MGTRITDSEIQKIQNLTNKTEQSAVELGAIKLQKIALANRKRTVVDQVHQLSGERLVVFKELEEKYGGGQLNVDTWEISGCEIQNKGV